MSFKRQMITASIGLAMIAGLTLGAKAYDLRQSTCTIPSTGEIVVLGIDKDNTDNALVTIRDAWGKMTNYSASWVYIAGKGVAVKIDGQNSWLGSLDNSRFVTFKMFNGNSYQAICSKFTYPPSTKRRRDPTNEFLSQY